MAASVRILRISASYSTQTPNFDDLSLSLNIIAILKWKLPLESVEKVVSKTECPKLFQPGLNYHNQSTLLGVITEILSIRTPSEVNLKPMGGY